ncbi:MAG TPA: PQQ-binding-like beta-propeller repeat protein [Vicinamibacterales bacterium]|nr:PQQ-binding-like beta-propeller repeat protein [Vicinamibacterales bacterium]
MSTVTLAQGTNRNWSQWRGPDRDGRVTTPLATSWPAALTKRWELTVGAGHSSPVVAGDRVVLHARQGDREITRAIALSNGKELWRDEYAAPYAMNSAARAHGQGPKSTPAVARGRVFTFGIGGILSALDLNTGKLLWRTPPPAVLPEYGTAMSPLTDGALVIAHMGGLNNGALTAFDAATGATRWRWTGDGPAYASPVVATIGGTRHVITQTQKSIVSVDAANGALLWQAPLTTPYEQNSVTPVVSGDLVIYSGLDHGVTAVRIARKGSQWVASPAWKNGQVSMYMSSPVINGTTLYGLSHRNRGQFFALDLATGKTLWTTTGREGENASLIAAGSLLLLSTTNAELIVARPNPAKFDEIRRYTVADSAVWAHPALAPRALLVKDVDKLICWSV